LKLFGGISDQQLVELYNQALMTVYAPVREPFGLVAIESMACGTPVIGVNDGGLTETILDGQVGRLVARDEAVFAQAVEQLLRDDNLRDQYGIQARSQVLQQWTWDAALERLKTNFQRVRVFPIS
jgi:glycosyltransferase involved in cell wall biosynthesis